MTQNNSGNNGSKAEIILKQWAGIDVFLNKDSEPFATLEICGIRRTCPLRSSDFKDALTFRFFQETGTSPGSTAISDAIDVLVAKSKFGGVRRDVFVRVGQHEKTIFIDLANDSARVVEVDAKGWRVTDNPTCRFYRPNGIRPLPEPVRGGGSLCSLIQPFVNLKSENDLAILAAWIVGAFRPSGPYPILAVHGEHGTAKSTLCSFLRSLIDPNTAPLRGQPHCEDDFVLVTCSRFLYQS